MRYAGINTGSTYHLLDHIAPLSALLRMPLIVQDEKNAFLTQKYYPKVSTHLCSNFSYLANEFDVLFTCSCLSPQFRCLLDLLPEPQKKIVFCPHGQSDKGFLSPVLAQYAFQEHVLLYGALHADMLHSLQLYSDSISYAYVGNYRLKYYKQHRAFYDSLAQKICPINPKKRTLLYAPTWKDADSSTSFFHFGKKVISELSNDWNLILKLHPHLLSNDPAYCIPLLSMAERKDNIYLIDDFPPVYPILQLADAFLGDCSSVGYDMLIFQKPMYFLPTQHTGRLHAAGKRIDPTKNLYSQLENIALTSVQKELYEYAFGPEQNLKENIHQMLGSVKK